MKVKLLEKEIIDAGELKENGFDFSKEYEVRELYKTKAIKVDIDGVACKIGYIFEEFEYEVTEK